jgi:hypothetical protein
VALALLVVPALFGAALSELHGANGGVRASVGNISAPWLLLAFASSAALSTGRPLRGVLAGTVATVAALCAFYTTNVWTFKLTGRPFASELVSSVAGGLYYIRLGVVSGPVMGLAGALWRRHRSPLLELALAGLLVLEPLAWLAYGGLQAGQLRYPIVEVVESACGLIAAAVLLIRWREAGRGTAA